jgi:outer membrane receptor protein involved in Fe transport
MPLTTASAISLTMESWACGTSGLAVTKQLNAVFGANFSKRTGSFYEATFDWYGVPYYNRNNYTAFTQLDYRPISSLKLIAGGQVIKIPGFDTYVAGGQTRDVSRIPGIDPHFAGRLGAVVTLSRNLGVKLLYSEAFRQPSVVDTDLIRHDLGNYSQEGNPALRPEDIATKDVQVFYGNARATAALTFFDSRQSNVIADTPFFALIQNIDESRTRGIEVEARVRPLRNVEVTSAMTYQRLHTERQVVFNTVAIPVPSFMGKFGISYRTESGLTVGLHDAYFGTPTESRNVNEEDPVQTTKYVNPTATAFHNLTLSVAYRLSKLRNGRDLTAHMYVNNLLDEPIYYAEYTSVNVNSIPGRPGRAVSFGLNMGF